MGIYAVVTIENCNGSKFNQCRMKRTSQIILKGCKNGYVWWNLQLELWVDLRESLAWNSYRRGSDGDLTILNPWSPYLVASKTV